MTHDPYKPEYKETIEADAVCNECSHVNPEGTLICKMCGNNLRDQRMRRLQADQIMDAVEEGMPRRNLLAYILPVLGLLIVVWVVVNVGNITELMTGSTESGFDANSEILSTNDLWNGGTSLAFEAMKQELLNANVTEEDAQQAFVSPAYGGTFGGMYALFTEDAFGNSEHVGNANAGMHSHGGMDAIFFIAQLTGGGEVRGVASISGIYLSSILSGCQKAGSVITGEGQARRRNDGTLVISAKWNVLTAGGSSPMSYEADLVGYRLPAPE